MSGVKHDQEKPDMSLLSAIAMQKVASVMTFGKRKYTANNWRGGISYSRLLAATLRHVFAYLGGESIDPESGESHLAHASCCLMMLLEFETTRTDLDDRYKQMVLVQEQLKPEKRTTILPPPAIELLVDNPYGIGASKGEKFEVAYATATCLHTTDEWSLALSDENKTWKFM